MLSFIVRGGVVMIPIAVLSIVALAIIIEKAIVMRRHPRYRGDAGDHAVQMLRSGSGASLVEELRAERGVEARMLLAGLGPGALGKPEREALMSAEAARIMAAMEERVGWLSSIANIATLLGLLGTVTGMIQAFAGVKAAGYSNPTVLSGGISEALITTAAGLAVAIPSLVCYHIFAGAISRRATGMELAAATLLTHLATKTPAARPAKSPSK